MDLFTIMLISFVSLVYYIVPIALIICFPVLLIKEIIPYLIFTIKFYLTKKRLWRRDNPSTTLLIRMEKIMEKNKWRT